MKFYKYLQAFGNTVEAIAAVYDRQVDADDLLSTRLHKSISYNKKSVLTSFTDD